MKPEIEADSVGIPLGSVLREEIFDSARDDGSLLTYYWGSDSAGEKTMWGTSNEYLVGRS